MINLEDIPNWALNQVHLKCGTELCRLVEIEIYCTPDPFVHKDEHQKYLECWYFHRHNSGQHRNGTFKGLDITFGHDNKYGGILVRSIQNVKTGEIIEGPCLVVNFILKTLKCDSVGALVNLSSNQPPKINDPNFPLQIVVRPEFTNDVIYSGPRVGLSLKKAKHVDDDYHQYIFRPLRYTCFPAEIHKNKCLMVLAYLQSGDVKSACSIFGVKEGKVLTWLDYFNQGQIGDLKSVKSLCESYGAITSLHPLMGSGM